MEEGEREAGETDEQFEERVLNRRAAQLFAVMKPKLAEGLQLSFNELAPRHNNRKQVTTFLVLLQNMQTSFMGIKWPPYREVEQPDICFVEGTSRAVGTGDVKKFLTLDWIRILDSFII